MAIENQTIGFIENSFSDALKIKRQKRVGTYYIDLYFDKTFSFTNKYGKPKYL